MDSTLVPSANLTIPDRDVVLSDVYAGLRRVGYTWLGAIRGLRVLGLSLAEAKAISDRYEAAR